MAFRIAGALAITNCDAVVDSFDVGGAGSIEIRTGSPPADVETAASGTLLATVVLPAPCFGAAADLNPGARATANAISSVIAVAGGTAGYYRVKNGSGTARAQGTCGTSASDMIFNSTTIALGSSVAMTAWTVDQPEV